MNIIDATRDPEVFGAHFQGSTWSNWIVFLLALFALPMTAEQLAVYQQFTGRSTPPTALVRECWLCIGRRGGKSFILATIAVFLACFTDWSAYLAAGEVGTIMIIAADRKQARVIKRFVSGLLHSAPMLAATIEEETQESITLRNRVVIEIHTASFRSTRGYTIIAALLDEVSVWPVEETAAEPDVETIAAIRPGMATIPKSMLLCASSPHARKGALWQAHQKHYGRDNDPVLVWQATTRDMNSSVPQAFIDEQLESDPVRASADYLAQFRSDMEGFVSREALQACVSVGVFERPPQPGISYIGFVDPAMGSAGGDSMAMCIGHMDYASSTVVIDVLREVKPPFSPEIVTSEFCALLQTYNISSVIGDRAGGGWCTEQFCKFGAYYDASTTKPKSDLYVDSLAAINSGRVDLLDHERAFNQALGLERRPVRGGGDSIDHAPGQHDDLINCIAGVISTLLVQGQFDQSLSWVSGPTDNTSASDRWQRWRLHNYLRRHGVPV